MDKTNRHHAGGLRVPKLRASCDGCNEAKVRCSQTRPSCARCLKNGHECIYGISQRSGKMSATAYQAKYQRGEAGMSNPAPTMVAVSVDTTSGTGSRGTPTSPVFGAGALGAANPQNQISSTCDAAGTYLSHNLSRMGSEKNSSTIFDSGKLGVTEDRAKLWTQQSSNLAEPALWTDQQLIFSPEEMFPTDSRLNWTDASTCLSASTQDSGFHSRVGSWSTLSCNSDDLITSFGHPPAPYDCRCVELLVSQTGALQRLFLPEHAPFDVELVRFQDAINICNSILACRGNSKDYCFILLVSAYVSRILVILERLGSLSIDPTTQLPTDPYNSTPKFTLGVYQMDADDEAQLKQEIWRLQAKKARALVTKFSETVSTASTFLSATQSETVQKLIDTLKGQPSMIDLRFTTIQDQGQL